MASLRYEFSPDASAYLRIAKGFKSGGFNGRANSATETSAYEPETVLSYEAGFKASIDRLRPQPTDHGNIHHAHGDPAQLGDHDRRGQLGHRRKFGAETGQGRIHGVVLHSRPPGTSPLRGDERHRKFRIRQTSKQERRRKRSEGDGKPSARP